MSSTASSVGSTQEDRKNKQDAKETKERKEEGDVLSDQQLLAVRDKTDRLKIESLRLFFERHDNYHRAAAKEVSELLAAIKPLVLKDSAELEKLQKEFIQFLQTQLEIIKRLNNEVLSKSSSYPVKTNKLVECLTGAIEFVKGEAFFTLCDGKIPEGYSISITSTGTSKTSPSTVLLSDTRNGLGNSKGTFLKTAVTMLRLFLAARAKQAGPQENKTQQDVTQTSNRMTLDDVLPLLKLANQDALVYAEVIPSGIDITAVSGWGSSCFIRQVPNTKNPNDNKFCLLVPHSAYGFGAGRQSTYEAEEFPFAPLDCSSGVAYVTCANDVFTAEEENNAKDPFLAFSTPDQFLAVELSLELQKRVETKQTVETTQVIQQGTSQVVQQETSSQSAVLSEQKYAQERDTVIKSWASKNNQVGWLKGKEWTSLKGMTVKVGPIDDEALKSCDLSKVELGDILVYRTASGGAHTVVVGDILEKGSKLVTFGWGRSMPKREGMGAEPFSVAAPPKCPKIAIYKPRPSGK